MEKVSTHFCKIIFLFVLCLFAVNGFTQTSKTVISQPVVSMQDRYKIDFEIVGMDSPDATVLNQLNMDQYEHLRQQNTRVNVLDQTTGRTIVLYHVNEATQNKVNRDFGPKVKMVTNPDKLKSK